MFFFQDDFRKSVFGMAFINSSHESWHYEKVRVNQ